MVSAQSEGVDAVDGSPNALPLRNPALRALRITLGAALFAAVLMVLGSAGAFASPGSSPAAVSAAQHNIDQHSSDKGKGLISGILGPIVDVVDNTVSQVTVVKDITGDNPVGKVLAPVTTVADTVENTVAKIPVAGPVVGSVATPVRNVGNAVVPSVAKVVETVTAPVLGTVDRVAAPVVEAVSPVLDPVTGTVRPVVDGVTGGVAGVVDDVVLPAVPSLPDLPGMPGFPDLPGTPGVVVPVLPGGGGDAVEGAPGQVPASAGAAVAKAGELPAAVNARVGPVDSGPLARYLDAVQHLGSTHPDSVPGAAVSPEGPGSAACGSDSSATTVGPCAPAMAHGPAAGTTATANAGGSGSAGGNAGPVAAHENAGVHFALARVSAALPGADWPLPASMPENPGSTPG